MRLLEKTNDRPQDYLLNKVFLKREIFPASGRRVHVTTHGPACVKRLVLEVLLMLLMVHGRQMINLFALIN